MDVGVSEVGSTGPISTAIRLVDAALDTIGLSDTVTKSGTAEGFWEKVWGVFEVTSTVSQGFMAGVTMFKVATGATLEATAAKTLEAAAGAAVADFPGIAYVARASVVLGVVFAAFTLGAVLREQSGITDEDLAERILLSGEAETDGWITYGNAVIDAGSAIGNKGIDAANGVWDVIKRAPEWIPPFLYNSTPHAQLMWRY